MPTDILEKWRKASKKSKTVSIRVNSLSIIEDFARDNGKTFDESLDYFIIYAFCHISRTEILKHIERLKEEELRGLHSCQN